MILGILWWKVCLGGRLSQEKELKGLDLQMLGEGGFGSAYKGILSNGTVIVVKQLSSKSRSSISTMGHNDNPASSLPQTTRSRKENPAAHNRARSQLSAESLITD